ncbi:hypothetical protein MKL09_24820 [Methylobacterium sp. J-048]|uniref:hypothetical protein n=1 Tax=Methylobacterium sp. J-048 TaxID=2836635 RepID=UPI001FB8CB84|nr:hypothetical protein [Methylobacterium sp. J-048]MCJ2059741.1 hypothetical protein [Methylobacterium sp. J-048]
MSASPVVAEWHADRDPLILRSIEYKPQNKLAQQSVAGEMHCAASRMYDGIMTMRRS